MPFISLLNDSVAGLDIPAPMGVDIIYNRAGLT